MQENYNTYAGTAVGVAGDPGTVDSKHHQQQQYNKHNNHPQVHSKIISLALNISNHCIKVTGYKSVDLHIANHWTEMVFLC